MTTSHRRSLSALGYALGLVVALSGASGTPAGAQPSAQSTAQPSAELRALASDPRVRDFYARRNWRPAWTDVQAQALFAALDEAPRHGLSARAFQDLARSSTGPARDVSLTLAALSYAKALSSGVVEPGTVHSIYTLERNHQDLAGGLDRALAQGDLAVWLRGLAPQDAEYRALSDAYLRVRRRIDAGESVRIPAGDLIQPGDSDPRIPSVAQALRDEGYLPAAAVFEGRIHGPALVEALKALQADYGLAQDGIVGPNTLAMLNAGPADRARQLAVNLERRRWLARNPPATRIDVNIAAAVLHYHRDGRIVWSTRVVAGSLANKTPLLGETFAQLVVNPPWNVPSSIARREILPRGRGYLIRNDMYVTDGRVVQRPGPNAALGLVKFDMQNRYAIYLHDTPAKSLFQSARRHRSHGCVRVQDAVEFARLISQEFGAGEAFETALASGETTVVPLDREILVRLLYQTAYVDTDSGQVRYRPDVYGWDAELAEALGLGAASRRAVDGEAIVPLGP